jgi:periplasmic divalent cation tolerance protein
MNRSDMERAVLVYTTYPSVVEAERAIVEQRLAACVNILPGRAGSSAARRR